MLTRIFSDLHYDDTTSHLRSLDMLRPLLDGADRVVLNGDTIDSQVIANGPALIAEVKTFFHAHVPETIFLSGNHDPDISDRAELTLANDLLWLTHGDIFFEYIAPWSPSLPEYRRRIDRLRAATPVAERNQLHTRFRILREACLKLPPEHNPHDRSLLHLAARLGRVFINPARPLAMLHAWHASPRHAAELAAIHHPRARFITFGHIHHPGVWKKRDGRIVINTGSFTPPRGALMIEFDEQHLRVKRIVRRNDAFHPDKIIAEFPLAPTTATA